MRGATRPCCPPEMHLPISIHAPHARSDWRSRITQRSDTLFQSTLLMRGATVGRGKFFSYKGFQSTLLMRGATQRTHHAGQRDDFNPRSSCEERPRRIPQWSTSSNFNPRSSCEERRKQAICRAATAGFQSTLLMRGATLVLAERAELLLAISIHAPHARSDLLPCHKQDSPAKISIHAPHARSDSS